MSGFVNITYFVNSTVGSKFRRERRSLRGMDGMVEWMGVQWRWMGAKNWVGGEKSLWVHKRSRMCTMSMWMCTGT